MGARQPANVRGGPIKVVQSRSFQIVLCTGLFIKVKIVRYLETTVQVMCVYAFEIPSIVGCKVSQDLLLLLLSDRVPP